MGAEFTALMDHKLTMPGIIELPTQLASCGESLSTAVRSELRRAPDRPVRGWEIEANPDFRSPENEWEQTGHLCIDGPAGLGIMLSRRLLEFKNSWTRFRWFLRDQPTQALLIPAVHDVARLVGATRIVYLPDSAYKSSVALDALYDGRGLGEVLFWLREQFGPPPTGLEELDSRLEQNLAAMGDGPVYYIDPDYKG